MAWIKKTTIISLSICIVAPCLSPCLCLVNKWTIFYTYSRETDRPTCVEDISASRDATEACHISKDAAGNSSEVWFSKDLAQSSFWCLESVFLRSFFSAKTKDDRQTCFHRISASRQATDACHISKSAANNSSETLFSKDLAKGSFSCLKSIFRNSIFLRILHIYLIKMFLVIDPRLEAWNLICSVGKCPMWRTREGALNLFHCYNDKVYRGK